MNEHGQSVRRMFASVVGRYDFLNRALSLGIDRRWRREAVRFALDGAKPRNMLDLCAGTGDLSLELARFHSGARIVAADFVKEMLERATAKIGRVGMGGRIAPVCADALSLPFADDQFDLVALAFGLRNIRPIEAALNEIRRVVRPGGRVVIVEFALPERSFWRRVYGFYLFRILPVVGNAVSGTRAYSYLSASVAEFPSPARLSALLEECGFAEAEFRLLTGGVVAVHTALVVK